MLYCFFNALDVGEIVPVSSDTPLGESESVICLSAVHISEPPAKAPVQLTQKAKKARKRRGTFENELIPITAEVLSISLTA